MNNVLNQPFTNRFESVPFTQIKPEYFLPAITTEIENTRNEIKNITESQDPPTFENTVEKLEFSGYQLDRITSLFFNLNSAETNDAIQKIAQQVSPLLTALQNDIMLDAKLFERIHQVYQQKDSLKLSPEQEMLLERKYRSFTRNGALLDETDKQKLRDIDRELSTLSLTFGENTLAATNHYELHITHSEELEGLPESAVEAAAELAASKGKEGWLFTLHIPSYLPFMTYAKNRELRKTLYTAYGSRAFGDAYDNRDIVLNIVRLRHQRAQLLGFQSHAHFVLEERMARTPEEVSTFLEDLLTKAKPAAEREFKELSAFAKQTEKISDLQKWDTAYFSEKLKQERFDLDDEKLKPYFPLDQVLQGVFDISRELYGLSFVKAEGVDVYHPEVTAYEVLNEKGEYLSLLYTDFHPRPGKRSGAWMTVYKHQFRKDANDSRPHISIVCNFSRPTSKKPSLLTFQEVTTLFHEFGHALHGMLAQTTYPSLSGTSVYWDFVELPSQIFENWCYEKEALERFARHYETGEVLPMEYINRIKESAAFLEGLQTLRQLSFGLLDMSWHSADPSAITDVKVHEDAIFKDADLYPMNAEVCMSTSFSHIFQGGYSSGYYSYKWAEVLDADAFELFKEKGIFDKETATRFRDTVLSKGGTMPPMELYKSFRGREPKPEALLKRAGLVG